VRHLRWSDISGKVITIPADRMKADKEHRIPLSSAAVDLLEGIQRIDDLVFPGMKPGQPLSDVTLLKVIKRMNEKGCDLVDTTGRPIVVHGFRSSFKTWATESTLFQREVIEMALAHTLGNKVEAAYLRGDAIEKRRALMEAWAVYLASPVRQCDVVKFKR